MRLETVFNKGCKPDTCQPRVSLSEPWDFNTKTMLLNDLQQYQIYLASKSPRRKELLAGMGVNFEVMTTDVEETYDPSWSPEQIVMHLSRLKLSPIDMAQYDPKTLFIACDTIVVVGGRIIGKPKDETEQPTSEQDSSGQIQVVNDVLHEKPDPLSNVDVGKLRTLIRQSERWSRYMHCLGYELQTMEEMYVKCEDATIMVRRLVHNFEEKMQRIENAIATQDFSEYVKYVDLRSMIDYYWIEEFGY